MTGHPPVILSMPSRIEARDYEQVATALGIDKNEVARAVSSFFDVILSDARQLPYDNVHRIYSKGAFDAKAVIRSLPGIGRIGPSYSKYLKWRANEAKDVDMLPRSAFKSGLTPEEIEQVAKEALSGISPDISKRKRTKRSQYRRVWLVGEEHRTTAKQVIPKKKKK